MISTYIFNKIREQVTKRSHVLELGEQILFAERGRTAGPRIRDIRPETATWTTIDLGSKSPDVVQADIGEYSEEWLIRFDLIIDGGTMEHVEPKTSQYQGFRNVSEYCAVGGEIWLLLPSPGTWPGHCRYRYPLAFFLWRGFGTNFEIIGEGEERLTFARLKRLQVTPFMGPKEFWSRVEVTDERPNKATNDPKGIWYGNDKAE
jgi:hypothetical protein